MFHLGKDLIVNGEDIFTEISQAVSLWEKQSYRDAGMQIGLALEKLVVGGSASAAADHATLVMAAVPALKHTWQYETTVDVFEGVLQGFFSSSEFPELKSCANNTVDAYEQLKDAFDKLHLSAEASDTIKQGLQDIATALGDLKQAMTECKASVSEIQQFADTLQTGFEHPVKFVYHLGKDLVVNGKDIFDEISQAVSLWEKQSYRDAGVQIGSALALLINGDVSNLEMN